MLVQSLKNKSYRSQLIKLKLYFLTHTPTCGKYSNYFLLGYRENHVIIRPSSLTDSLERLKLFSKLVLRSKSSLWAIGFKPKYFNPTRWVAYKLQANFILFTGRRGIMFYVNKRYFWVSHRFFTYRLLFILGIDLVLFTNLAESKGFQTLLKTMAIPSIGVVTSEPESTLVTYPLFTNLSSITGLIFTLRLLTFFLSQTK
jgi:hypothetical protein